MLSINGTKNVMIEHILGDETIGIYDINVEYVVVKNGHQIITDENGCGIVVPEDIKWTECGDEIEVAWEADLGNGTLIRLSWSR